MRQLEDTKPFRQDKRRIEMSGRYRRAMKERFAPAVVALLKDEPLDASYHDHALSGDMKGYRECHIRPDLLLVYRYVGEDWLILERLGSHAELFGM